MQFSRTLGVLINKQINAKPFQLCANYSYLAQGIYLIDKTDKIPCAILEWSDTILELHNQVGILTLRRAILEWYRFPLCAEHMHCSLVLGVFIVCYLAFISSQVYALQPSIWSVHCMLLSLHFGSSECIAA